MIIVNKLWNAFEKVLRFFLNLFFKIINKDLTEEIWIEFIRFVKFGMIGAVNTVISLSVYYIFVIYNRNLYILGNAVGFVVSVLNSYFLNSRFVFKKRDEVLKTVIKTYLAYGTNIVIGTVLLYIFVDLLNISEFIAPLINLLITVPLNYILNKNWVMKK